MISARPALCDIQQPTGEVTSLLNTSLKAIAIRFKAALRMASSPVDNLFLLLFTSFFIFLHEDYMNNAFLENSYKKHLSYHRGSAQVRYVI